MVATCSNDFKLESVLCRLRAGARAVFATKLADIRPNYADYDERDFIEERDEARSKLRRIGYSEEAYQEDRVALKAALLAAANAGGEMALERIGGIVNEFHDIYLSGPDATKNISDLTLAIRNWLPFVSYSPYFLLYDEVTPMREMKDMVPLPEMSMEGGPSGEPEPIRATPPGGVPPETDLLALAEQHDRVGILKAKFAASYMPWRTLEQSGDPTDPRCQVVATQGETDQDLRARLYLQHPILLVVQNLSPPTELQHRMPPRELQKILLMPALEREQALRQVVKLCVQHLREAGEALRRELFDNEVDWSRFRPLLEWGAQVIAKGEPQSSVVHVVLSEIISDIAKPRWTQRESLAAAAVVVAVVMAIASFGIGGVAGIALMITDIAVQATAVHAHELLTERENAERDRINRVAAVDAALRIASDPEVSQLGWWLGVISLMTLPVSAVGLASSAARFLRGQALGRARALDAARNASMNVKVTRFKVYPEPPVEMSPVTSETPPVGGRKTATETPAVPRNSESPALRSDGKKTFEPDLLDEMADDAVEPVSKTPVANVATHAPQLDLNPAPRPRRRSRLAEESLDDALINFEADIANPHAQVMSELQELIEATNATNFHRALIGFENEITKANVDALAELIEATKARDLQLSLAELEQTIANTNARAEFQRAFEDGLSRKLAANPYAWEKLVADWTNAGYSADDISRLSEAANRGLLRRRGVEPANTGGDQSMRLRSEELIRISSTRSKVETSTATARTAQTKVVLRPNSGRPTSPAEKGTTARSVAPRSTSQAPKGWQIQRIDPDNPPDLVTDGIVFEFSTGERVWRSASEDRAIVIESILGPSSRRRHFEQAYFSRGEMDPSYVKAQMERAHSQGQSTGFESPFAITYAPAEVNQILQNLGIEEFLRVLYQNRSPGMTYKLITSTHVHARSLRLSLIEYKVVAEIDGKARTLFTTGIRVEGKAEESVVSLAEDLTSVDPEAFSLLPINDLDPSIVQRQREMFERIRARWRNR